MEDLPTSASPFDLGVGLDTTENVALPDLGNKDSIITPGTSIFYTADAIDSDIIPLVSTQIASIENVNTTLPITQSEENLIDTTSEDNDPLLGLAPGGTPLVGSLTETTTINITATANGSQTPPTGTRPETVLNGDFEISGNNELAPIVGDGLDELTSWTFDFTQDPEVIAFQQAESITSATLTLELNPRLGVATDTTGIEGLRFVISPEITNLPLLETSTIAINLLDTYSSEEILEALQKDDFGEFQMYYDDDAIVSGANLELTREIPPIYDSGVFTVGDTGQVTTNFLFDGGNFDADLGLFSLEGMETLEPGSTDFIQEAARRALTNSTMGHIVISDRVEGARFSGELPYEPDFNDGEYSGSKTFEMNPGERFGFMLVPDGWTQEFFDEPGSSSSTRPLFSMTEANPGENLQFVKLLDIEADDNSFAFEDLLVEGKSDRDYNDLVFYVKGATGQTAVIDDVINPERDWRNTDLGQKITIYPKPKEFPIDLEKDLGLVNEPIQVGEGVWFLGRGIDPDDLKIVKPNNVAAADTTNTDQIQPGGGLGLNLTGAGLTVGVWEATENATNSWRIRDTHEQLNGRVTLVDAGTGFSDHATHVAGTIAANGTGNPAARGMANEINLRSYSSENDIAQLDQDAGLIVASNHSYGISRGWEVGTRTLENGAIINNTDVWNGDYSISPREDINFGKYNDTSQALDRVLFDNPNLLSVWSAGNDRGERFTNRNRTNTFVTNFGSDPGIPGFNWSQFGDGWYQLATNIFTPPGSDGNGGTGYDSLPDNHVAKNSLVVGAINDIRKDPYTGANVNMTSFSSWGPTDDGRVKPDVVANGSLLNSSEGQSDTDYGFSSGTSMAAPNVTGTAALLIQHYQNLFNGTPRSATTKGLLIHTATDAGNVGPDYSFGWGLVNAEAAANFLTNSNNPNSQSFLRERTYTGSEQVISVESNGTNPLKVSLVWTDPAGRPQPTGLDLRGRALVNDLDIQIIDPNGVVHYPWSLDPANPSNPAVQTTSNSVDNVEQVLINSPIPGNYEIRINHKGKAFTQDYSLLTDGAQFIEDIFREATISVPGIFNFRPQKTRGDREFSGNGPRIKVEAQVVPNGSTLRVVGNALFEETESNFTTFTDNFSSSVVDISKEYPGFVIDSILSKDKDFLETTDVDLHDKQVIFQDNNDLVKIYEIQGDTKQIFSIGSDKPFVSIFFNPVKLRMSNPQTGEIIEDEFFLPNINQFTPPKVGKGDGEFDGNGPIISITTEIIADGSILKYRLTPLFLETKKDSTLFVDTKEGIAVDVTNRYPGFVIDSILSDNQDFLQTVDLDIHETQSIDLGGNQLIRRYNLEGDSKGNDEPFVSLFFNPIKVKLRKV